MAAGTFNGSISQIHYAPGGAFFFFLSGGGQYHFGPDDNSGIATVLFAAANGFKVTITTDDNDAVTNLDVACGV